MIQFIPVDFMYVKDQMLYTAYIIQWTMLMCCLS